MKVRIDVTPGHIVIGDRLNPQTCPVARALGEVVNSNLVHVSVGVYSISLTAFHNNDWINIGLPEKVSKFIKIFDNIGGRYNKIYRYFKMQPFSFDIELPDKYLMSHVHPLTK